MRHPAQRIRHQLSQKTTTGQTVYYQWGAAGTSPGGGGVGWELEGGAVGLRLYGVGLWWGEAGLRACLVGLELHNDGT